MSNPASVHYGRVSKQTLRRDILSYGSEENQYLELSPSMKALRLQTPYKSAKKKHEEEVSRNQQMYPEPERQGSFTSPHKKNDNN